MRRTTSTVPGTAPTQKETEKNTERAEQTLSDPGYGENEREERAPPPRGVLASPENAERLLGCGVGDGDDVGQSWKMCAEMIVRMPKAPTQKETEKNTERAEQTLSDPGYGESEREERAKPTRGDLASPGYGANERKEKAEPTARSSRLTRER